MQSWNFMIVAAALCSHYLQVTTSSGDHQDIQILGWNYIGWDAARLDQPLAGRDLHTFLT